MDIYLIKAANGLYKIGKSSEPQARLRALQGSSPVVLELLHLFKGNHEAEEGLHRLFSHCRTHNEWFALNPEEVNEILSITRYTGGVYMGSRLSYKEEGMAGGMRIRNFRLSEEVWLKMEDVCYANNCLSETGSTKGRPSISVLLRRITEGSYLVIPAVDQGPAKPPIRNDQWTSNQPYTGTLIDTVTTTIDTVLPEPEPASEVEYADPDDPFGQGAGLD